MSRNLCSVECYYCGATPSLDEVPRPIKEEEAKVYFDEYKGMQVANATCKSCHAKYLAWIKYPSRDGDESWETRENFKKLGFCDLSFRSTFNDEAGGADLPLFDIETTIKLLGKEQVSINRKRVGPSTCNDLKFFNEIVKNPSMIRETKEWASKELAIYVERIKRADEWERIAANALLES